MTQPAREGIGRPAAFGPRLLAFVVDGLLADVLAFIVDGGFHADGHHNLVTLLAFLAIELVFVSLAGQTPGMRVVGIAVISHDGRRRPRPQWVALRTLLLAIVVPALIPDSAGRWLHDRASGTELIHVR